MKKQKLSFPCILFLGLMCAGFTSSASAGQLRFLVDDTSYDKASSNPWFNEGFITKSKDFDLGVVNTFTNKDVKDVKLVLSVPKTIDLNGLEIDLGNSKVFSAADFMNGNTGNHPYLKGNNGIYKDAYWLEIKLGDLAKYNKTPGGADTKTLHVKINDMPKGALLHFDAYGTTSSKESKGKGWEKDKGSAKVFVPYSEDLTVVTPEPVSASLFLFGTLPLAFAAFRRRMLA